jgi:hypothetical protein
VTVARTRQSRTRQSGARWAPVRQALDLLLWVAGATRLTAVVVTSLMSLAFLVLPLLLGLGEVFKDFDASMLFHLSMIVSLAGAGFVLDDPAQETLAVTVVGHARVALIRIGMGLAVLVPVWGTQLALIPTLIARNAPFSPWGYALEGPLLAVWIWAVSLTFSARFAGQGSTAAMPFALIGLGLLLFLPGPVALFVNQAAPDFTASRIRLAVVGALGTAVLAHALVLRSGRSQWRGLGERHRRSSRDARRT